MGEFNPMSPVSLTKVLNQNLPPRRFLSRNFFGIETHATETIGIDVVKGSRKIAPFCTKHDGASVVASEDFETKFFKTSQINLKQRTAAAELLTRYAGENISYADGIQRDPARAFGAKIAREQQGLVDKVYRTIEKMAADALFSGKVEMLDVNGDKIDEIEIGIDDAHKVTLSGDKGWDKAGSDPIADIRTWKRQVAKDSGLTPTDLILGTEASDAFFANEKVHDYLNKLHINVGEMAPVDGMEGAEFMAKILGINIWTYEETYIDPKTGDAVALIPAKKACLLSRELRATVHFGLIADVQAGKFETQMFSRMYDEQDGSATWLQLRSAPLAVVHQPDGLLIADVVVGE